MTVKLYAMTCGWLTMRLGSMLVGEEGMIKVPVPCYLIDHPKGKVLFDSGMNKASISEPDDYLGPMAKFFSLHFNAGEELQKRLELLQVAPGDITHLVNSHLHFDHAGGNDQVTKAPVIVQRPEWEAATASDIDPISGYLKRDYDIGQDVKKIDGEHDIFGDGSVVCIPTPGHTPGHQSLRVRLAGGDVVLSGDACYLRRTLEEMRLPIILHDKDQMLDSLKKLRELQSRGARIFYGHDPEFWESVPQAPAEVV